MPADPKHPSKPPPAKVLVVYFSRTGNTRRVAERLAAALDGRLCAIEEAGSRLGLLGYLRSLWQAVSGCDTPIHPLAQAPEAASLVLIGTPIWGWQLASPVRAFMRRHGPGIRRFGFFCTMGGSGDRAAFDEMQRLAGKPPLATLALTEAEIDGSEGARKLRAFVDGLRAPSP